MCLIFLHRVWTCLICWGYTSILTFWKIPSFWRWNMWMLLWTLSLVRTASSSTSKWVYILVIGTMFGVIRGSIVIVVVLASSSTSNWWLKSRLRLDWLKNLKIFAFINLWSFQSFNTTGQILGFIRGSIYIVVLLPMSTSWIPMLSLVQSWLASVCI